MTVRSRLQQHRYVLRTGITDVVKRRSCCNVRASRELRSRTWRRCRLWIPHWPHVTDLTGLERLVNLTSLNLSISPPNSGGRFLNLTPSKYFRIDDNNWRHVHLRVKSVDWQRRRCHSMNSNGSTGNRKTPFFRFDLSSQAGQQVSGDARFSLNCEPLTTPEFDTGAGTS